MGDGLLHMEVQYDAQGNVVPLGEEVTARGNFGSRAAAQMSAQTEQTIGRRDARAPREGQGGTFQKTPTTPDYHEKLAAMSFDQRVDATIECLGRRGTFRDILYGLLGFCAQERSYEEIAVFVEQFPDFRRNRQEPDRYVFMLLRTGALEEIELDEQGDPLTPEAKQAAIEGGLDPQDEDLLVFDWRVATTAVGRKVHEEHSPLLRFQKLLVANPDRKEAFLEIMDFCRSPRFMGQIDDEFKGSALLGFDDQTSQMRQPSSYMEKLERAGMVFWDNQHWMLSEQGKAYLDGLEAV